MKSLSRNCYQPELKARRVQMSRGHSLGKHHFRLPAIDSSQTMERMLPSRTPTKHVSSHTTDTNSWVTGTTKQYHVSAYYFRRIIRASKDTDRREMKWKGLGKNLIGVRGIQ